MIKPTFLININSVQRLLKVLGHVLYFSCLDVWVCMHTHLCVCEYGHVSATVQVRGQRTASDVSPHCRGLSLCTAVYIQLGDLQASREGQHHTHLHEGSGS